MSTASRPCLATVESLGDRILLSASGPKASAVVTEGGGGDVAILIGLLKASEPIVNDELATIKLAAGSLDTLQHKLDYLKLSAEFLKLDTTLFEFAEAAIKGDLNLDKWRTALGNEIHKLTDLATDLGGSGEQNQLLPAVQNIGSEAGDLLGTIAQLGGSAANQVDHKVELQLIKLSEAVVKIDRDLIKLGATEYAVGDLNGQKAEVLAKIEQKWIAEDLLKLHKLAGTVNNQDLSSALASAEKDLAGIAAGIVGAPFDGGVGTVGNTGDTIA